MKVLIKNNKLLGIICLITICTAGLTSYLGAYLLTHYSPKDKISLGFPRPENYKLPTDIQLEYISQRIEVNKSEWIDTWLIKQPLTNAQGTVILLHGKDTNKSSLLASAKVFYELGYESLLIDFRGVGGSSGNSTTIGVRESKDVVLAVKHIQTINPDHSVILYGISMGSAAILRAIALEKINPDAVILELPFSSLLRAVKSRLNSSKIPNFPLGELLVFWGGIQHNFNGFAHNPVDYAKQVKCPVLILHGSRDRTVAIEEIEELYQNVETTKKLVLFPHAEHELLVKANRQLWQDNVEKFLGNLKQNN